MTHRHTNRRHRRLAATLAGLGLVATACGAETVASTQSAPVATTSEATAADATIPVDTTVPTATVASTTVAPTTVAPTTVAPVEPADETTTTTTVATPPAAADDLAAEPAEPDPPQPQPIDDLVLHTGDDEPEPCTLPAMPVGAVIGGEIWFDHGSGAEDHRVVSYRSDGSWKLRVEFSDGAASELEIPGAGVHGVRPIGFADVDQTYGGEELLAVVGGGASTVEVGFFTFLEGGCIHRYQSALGGDFGVHVGATTEWGAGLQCGEGYVVVWGYGHDGDGTYSSWTAAFEPVSLPVFGYMPSSDGFDEGLTLDEVTATPLFDCAGLEL